MARYNNKQLAHVWAQQDPKYASGSNSSGSFRFEGKILLSYSTVIARFVDFKGKSCFITNQQYSVTTATQLGMARRAVSGVPVFHLWDVSNQKPNHKANLEEYNRDIDRLAQKLRRARSNGPLDELRARVAEANSYAEFFGLKSRFAAPTNEWVAERLKTIAEAEKKKEAARLAAKKREKAAQEAALQQWLRGEPVDRSLWALPVHLRLKPGTTDTVETTKGAAFPLDQALRVLPLIRRGIAWRRNGEQVTVGHFRVDAIDEHGNVVAGCHRITRAEIERFAATLGV
jgi:uncharacterized protein YeaO (DUF488 family)